MSELSAPLSDPIGPEPAFRPGTMPATFGVLTVMLVLFVSVEVSVRSARNSGQRLDAIRRWGLIEDLMVVNEPELHGPFDLWRGEWWRIVPSSLHPGGGHSELRLIELILTLAGLGYLGWLTEPLRPGEPSLGTFGTFGVAIVGGLLTVQTELLLGQVHRTGLGSVAALVGWGVVMRSRSERLTRRLPPSALIAAGVVMTLATVTEVAGRTVLPGFGLFAALAVGAFIGGIDRLTDRRTARWVGLLICGLVVVSLIRSVCQPETIGRYHWWRSRNTAVVEEKRHHLRRAVETNPSLVPAWLELSRVATAETQSRLPGWSVAVEGLLKNRSSSELESRIRTLWKRFPGRSDHLEALAELDQLGGGEGERWRRRLNLVPRMRSVHSAREKPGTIMAPLSFRPVERPEPKFDPNAIDSAAEGVLL